jgi:hypothetical protein
LILKSEDQEHSEEEEKEKKIKWLDINMYEVKFTGTSDTNLESGQPDK